jgi:hypothetical protein
MRAKDDGFRVPRTDLRDNVRTSRSGFLQPTLHSPCLQALASNLGNRFFTAPFVESDARIYGRRSNQFLKDF